MSMKLGSRYKIAGTPYEVVSILADGGLRLRRIKGGRKSDGCQYDLGERVRIVGVDQDNALAGEIVNLEPLQASVTERGAFYGYVACSKKIRKLKRDTE